MVEGVSVGDRFGFVGELNFSNKDGPNVGVIGRLTRAQCMGRVGGW